MKTLTLIKYLSDQIRTAIEQIDNIAPENDIENLHKYRVALRRSRALLKLYFPEAYAYEEIIKSIFKTTNRLRELDVFVSMVDKKQFPILYSELQKYRHRLYKKRFSAKMARSYRKALQKLDDDLHLFYTDEDPFSLEKRGMDYFKSTLVRYRSLPEDCSEEVLHKFRIEFKISRYALEFLNECGLEKTAKKIKRCKKILDNLGEIQDSTNQLQLLEKFCKRSHTNECKSMLTLLKKQHKKLIKRHEEHKARF